MKVRFFSFAAVISLVTALAANAQKPRLYTSVSDLPNTKINVIYQDRKGFVWVGTEDGIARFDGTRFTSFHNSGAASGSGGSETILSILEDSRGVTWVGTSQELQIFDQEHNSFQKFDLRDGDEPGMNYYVYGLLEVPGRDGKSRIAVSVSQHGIYFIDTETHELDNDMRMVLNSMPGIEFTNRMFLDSDGRMWLASEFGGFKIFDLKRLESVDVKWKTDSQEMSRDVLVSSFAEDERTGNIIIASSNAGIFLFEKASGIVRQASDRSARSCKAMVIEKDSRARRVGDRMFLLGTENNGLKIFDLDSETVRDATFFNIPYSSDTWKVHCLLADNQGNIWAGAYQTGLLLIPQSMFGFFYRAFSGDMIPGENSACVTSIIEDNSDKSTWVGTDGSGIFHIDAGRKVTCFTENNSALTNNSITGLALDRRGTLWIATYLDGIVRYTSGSGFRPFEGNGRLGTTKVFCILYDEDADIIYAGTYGNGMSVIQASTGKVIRTISDNIIKWVNTLFQDKDGIIWLGTNNGPVCYNPESERLFAYDQANELSIARVSAISQDSSGAIWLGTDAGLVSIQNSGGKVVRYTEEDGLSGNNIHGILEDNDRNIWVSTSKGLSMINTTTGSIKRYYAHDGLQGNEFRTNAFFKSSNGQLHFGGTNGMTSFYPQTTGSQSHDIPQVYFTRLLVGENEITYDPESDDNYLDKYITDATSIVLPYSKNAFAIQFSVPEFADPQRIRYEYRLDKFDKDWKTAAFSNDAIYTNLRHGRYSLTVKAYFDGNEDVFTTRSIKIRILPPPSLSIWAILFYLLLAAGVAAFLYDYWKNIQKRNKEKEESDIKEMKLEMFTNLSHEIRTPLTLVMSPLKKLREAEEDSKKKELYNLMYRNSLRILRLVNQVIDIRKVDNGQMNMHFTRTDAVYVIKDIMKSFDNMAASRNIDFTLESGKDRSEIWVDQGSFDKIMFNIISNAFKYTPDGGRIIIGISGEKSNDGKLGEGISKFIDITVTNSGSKIKEKDLSRIFERYYQSNIYDAKAGSGIGLNLAKSLVDMHHGAICAENIQDGVKFTVSLPAGSSHLSAEEISADAQSSDIYSNGIYQDAVSYSSDDIANDTHDEESAKVLKSKRTVVFIDDNVEMLRYIKMELGDTFNLETFSNVKEAWAAITASLPDAIVTDLIMKTEDEGADFCEKIKHNPGTNHIPVLILSSKTDEESIQKCTESGADRYLTKPISTKLLKSTIIQTIIARDTIRNKYTNEVGYDFEEVKMSSSDDRLLSRVIESIKANIDNPDYGVEELSRDVGMSRVHMNRKLKECISLSPSNLIKSIRLKQAAFLLANNKVNISEVAYRVGFSTHSYFSSSFHDYFGLTPKEFVARYSGSKDEESLKKLLEL